MNPLEYKSNTALHHAIKRGTLNDVKKAMSDYKEYINVKNSDGNTALHLAVELNLLDRVKVLLESGSDVNVQNSSGLTPLHFALTKYYELSRNRCLVELRDYDLNSSYNNEVIRLLIQAPHANLRLTYESLTYLHYAVVTWNVEATELLIDKCPSLVNLEGPEGAVALHMMSKSILDLSEIPENKIFMICNALVGKGKAQVDIYDEDMNTPLHYAVKSGICSIIEMLVFEGANCNVVNIYNETPLTLTLSASSEPGGPERQSMENTFCIDQIFRNLDPNAVGNRLYEAIATYLVLIGGADLQLVPNKNKPALDVVEDMEGLVGPTEQEGVVDFQPNEMLHLCTSLVNRLQCSICANRAKNVTLGCGHRYCEVCSNEMVNCSLCNTPKVIAIKEYN